MLTVWRFSGMANKASPLLRLPRELRDMIWEKVLGHKTYVAVIHRRWKTKDGKPNLSLLLSCRQIYWETALLPFQANIFQTELPVYQFPLHLCLARIKECFRSHITKLELDVEHFSPPFNVCHR